MARRKPLAGFQQNSSGQEPEMPSSGGITQLGYNPDVRDSVLGISTPDQQPDSYPQQDPNLPYDPSKRDPALDYHNGILTTPGAINQFIGTWWQQHPFLSGINSDAIRAQLEGTGNAQEGVLEILGTGAGRINDLNNQANNARRAGDVNDLANLGGQFRAGEQGMNRQFYDQMDRTLAGLNLPLGRVNPWGYETNANTMGGNYQADANTLSADYRGDAFMANASRVDGDYGADAFIADAPQLQGNYGAGDAFLANAATMNGDGYRYNAQNVDPAIARLQGNYEANAAQNNNRINPGQFSMQGPDRNTVRNVDAGSIRGQGSGSTLSSTMSRQAQEMLDQGDQLNARQQRDAEQLAREGFNDRGRVRDTGAVIAEMMENEQARRARRDEARSYGQLAESIAQPERMTNAANRQQAMMANQQAALASQQANQGADLSVLGMGQQAGLANQSAGMQAALANLGADESNTARLQQAEMFNAGQRAGVDQFSAGLGANISLDNASRNDAAARYGTDNAFNANLANMSAHNQVALNNAARVDDMRRFNAGQTLNADQLNQAAMLQGNLNNAGRIDDMRRFTAGNQLESDALNAQLGQQTALNNAGRADVMNQFNVQNWLNRDLSNQSAMNNMGQFNANQLFNQDANNMAAMNNMGQFNANQLFNQDANNMAAMNNMAQFNTGNRFNADLTNLSQEQQERLNSMQALAAAQQGYINPQQLLGAMSGNQLGSLDALGMGYGMSENDRMGFDDLTNLGLSLENARAGLAGANAAASGAKTAGIASGLGNLGAGFLAGGGIALI